MCVCVCVCVCELYRGNFRVEEFLKRGKRRRWVGEISDGGTRGGGIYPQGKEWVGGFLRVWPTPRNGEF